MELADALLENNSVIYLEVETKRYTKSSAEALAKYVRTSKRLQRMKKCCVVYCLQFKKAHRSSIYTFTYLSLVGRPTWLSKIC
jgi:hypothetical protein